MKRSIAILLCAVSFILHGTDITPEHQMRARHMVSQMTLDEKIACLSGKTSFSLRENKRLGIPEIRLADGPQGIRNHAPHSTLYPCGVLATATWNRDIINRYGRSLGDDARARGVGILLGPGVNIYRSPLCGRNYEYMGEDPYLTSEIAAEYIKGVQSRGVIATVKHFAANNQEWNRHHASSDVDERTLNEIYFPAFRKAIKKAGVGAVMNSYNLVNGVHATENRWLNIDVLRDKWGFNGILMSDWTSVYSTVGAANAGLDLEMPKAVYFTPEKLRKAIETGRVSEATIDRKVEHLLSTFIAFGLLDRAQTDSTIALDYAPSRATALEVAREGIVLLKNQDKILPLHGSTLILGPNADTIQSGGGSGSVSPFSVTPLAKALKSLHKKTVILHDDDLYHDITGDIYTDSTLTTHGFTGRYFKNQTREGKPDVIRTDAAVSFHWEYDAPFADFPEDHFSATWTCYYQPEKDGLLKIRIGGDDGYRILVNDSVIAGDWGNHSYSTRETEFEIKAGEKYKFHIDYFDNISSANIDCSLKLLDEERLLRELHRADNVVYCTGFNGNIEGEGFDRSFALPEYQNKFINKIAHNNPNLTVVINSGGGIDFSPWSDKAKAILMAWYPGQEGGQAIAEILTGKLSPGGKLPISIERDLKDNPSAESYHQNVPSARECTHIDYSEGIFTGYRGYDRNGITPLYPFGFGLSYSTFELKNMQLKKLDGNRVEVSLDITNTGKITASEVIQIYVQDVICKVPRPVKELKGFEKANLKPGETRRVSIVLDEEAFAYYDLDSHDFMVEPGEFIIFAGNSSENLPLQQKITI